MSTRSCRRGSTWQAVLDYLVSEADMDGLVTVSGQEVADALGIAQTTAAYHIRALAIEGLLTILPEDVGPKNTLHALQLSEEVYA